MSATERILGLVMWFMFGWLVAEIVKGILP